MPSRTSQGDRRDFLFHNQLAEYGPVRLTVDGPISECRTRKGNTNPVIDVTLMPKAGSPTPFTYWVENDACGTVLTGLEQGVPVTVIAEGAKAGALVTVVGRSMEEEASPRAVERMAGPDDAPKSEPRRYPTPHDTAGDARKAREDKGHKAAADARVFLARRVSLKRLCVRATLALDKECQSAGAPPMPPETFWSQVTNFYISLESEGLAIRSGFADALPVDLTFERMKEMATTRKPDPEPQPQRGAEPPTRPTPPDTVANPCPHCGEELRASADGSSVCANTACKSNDNVPF
jgi:hypothetical protein